MKELFARDEEDLVAIIIYEALKNGYLRIGSQICGSIGVAICLYDTPYSLVDVIANNIAIYSGFHSISDMIWLDDIIAKHLKMPIEQWIKEYSGVKGIDEVLGQFPRTIAFGESGYTSAIDPHCSPIR